MIKKIKQWLEQKFLPAYLKDEIYRERNALREKVEELENEINTLQAYIDGLETGLKAVKHVTIKNEVAK